MTAISQTIQWIASKDSLPDDDITVLIALADGEVWTGFHDAGIWRFVSADAVTCEVEHWAAFPEPPTRAKGPGWERLS